MSSLICPQCALLIHAETVLHSRGYAKSRENNWPLELIGVLAIQGRSRLEKVRMCREVFFQIIFS